MSQVLHLRLSQETLEHLEALSEKMYIKKSQYLTYLIDSTYYRIFGSEVRDYEDEEGIFNNLYYNLSLIHI